jgi:hypothetical protein
MDALLASFNPLTLLSAFLPVGVEAAKALVQKHLAPDQVKPVDFGQLLEMRKLDLELWEKMQGGEAPSYLWVTAVRQLQRPVVVAAIIGVWVYHAPTMPIQLVQDLGSCVIFYLFGDRVRAAYK